MRRAPGLPYPPPDLNRHALRALAPKASASANSARGVSTARAAQKEHYPTRVATWITSTDWAGTGRYCATRGGSPRFHR